MQAVNLLPADARVTKKPFSGIGGELPGKRTLQIGGSAAVVLALAVAGLYIHERSTVNHKRSELAQDNARLVAVQAQVNAVRSAETEAAARTAAISSVVSARMNWDRTMNELARVLPSDVFLTSLQAGAPVTAAAAVTATQTAVTAPTTTTSTDTTATAATTTPVTPVAGTSTVTIAGVAPSYVRLATVLDKLALLPWLSNITLQSASNQGVQGTTFSIQAAVSEVR